MVQPTLTVFNPTNAARANGTAVIVAPGGGFVRLAVDMEGYEAARQLAALGYTAIVLKYRTRHTADTDEEYLREQARARPPLRPQVLQSARPRPIRASSMARPRCAMSACMWLNWASLLIASGSWDFQRAVAWWTQPWWGATTRRPNFAAQIYSGAADDVKWSPNTPPMFLAVAADDSLPDSVLSAWMSSLGCSTRR